MLLSNSRRLLHLSQHRLRPLAQFTDLIAPLLIHLRLALVLLLFRTVALHSSVQMVST